MKATNSEISQSSLMTRRSTRGNGTVEDNHDDSIVNENDNQELQKSTLIISPKKRKGLVDDELTHIDIPALMDLVKGQSEEIAGLKETVLQLSLKQQQSSLKEQQSSLEIQQLNFKVDKQSQVIENLKKCLSSYFSSWESISKKNQKDGPGNENPGPSNAGRVDGRPSTTNGVPAIKDVTKSPVKRGRGRPPKQDKKAKISIATSNDEEIENSVLDQDQEEPCSSATILDLPSSGSNDEGIENRALDQDQEEPCSSDTILDLPSSGSNASAANGKDDASEDSDDEVKDTSFVPYKKEQAGSNLKKGRSRKAKVIRRNEKQRCKHCGKMYKSKGILATHIKTLHGGNRFTCSHCPGTFAQLSQLQVHVKLHDKKGLVLEKCKVCGMELNGRKGVMIHLATAHKIYAGTPESKKMTETRDDELFKCQLCEMIFAKKELLRDHMTKTHDASGTETSAVLEQSSTAEEMETTTTNGADESEIAA